MQRGVVDDGAVIGGVGVLLDRVEGAQAEDVLGEDGVGVAQPGPDLGDAEAARAEGEGRTRGRRRDRGGGAVGKVELGGPPCGGMGIERSGAAAQEGAETDEPAGGDGRGAVAAERAGQDDVRRGAGQHGEIVRHLADAFFGRGQAHGPAHGAAHPGARVGGGGPDGLGEAAEDDEIDGLEARFEQAEDGDAGVFGAVAAAQRPAAADDGALHGGFEQARQGGEALGREDGESVGEGG